MKQSRRKKIAKPGELLYSGKYAGTSNETEQKLCSSSKLRRSEQIQVNEDVWRCNYYKVRWLRKDGDGNRWVVCDICSKKYHLQCSCIDYAEYQYYKIDIENKIFFL